MTDKSAMLKLALAVYPEVDWMGYLENGKHYACDVHTGEFVFDPANNDSQAVAVLCWLMRSPPFEKLDQNVVECWGTHIDRDRHNATPASLRAAILKAALRVVS